MTGVTARRDAEHIRNLAAIAGLWERWKDPSGNWIKSCSILTTTPNAVTSAAHDRMPVILHPDNYDLWLDHAANDDPECSVPLAAESPSHGQLF
jgi:putative SOS response-associated peptidase YedK